MTADRHGAFLGPRSFWRKLMDFLGFHPIHPSFMGLKWWV
jgi:hypothetical protein